MGRCLVIAARALMASTDDGPGASRELERDCWLPLPPADAASQVRLER
jgi:hypothetical protein